MHPGLAAALIAVASLGAPEAARTCDIWVVGAGTPEPETRVRVQPNMTVVKGRIVGLTGYRTGISMDPTEVVWNVRLALEPIDAPGLPQPYEVVWVTGQCGPNLLPEPLEGRDYQLLVSPGTDGAWVVEDVANDREFAMYLARVRH